MCTCKVCEEPYTHFTFSYSYTFYVQEEIEKAIGKTLEWRGVVMFDSLKY